MLHARCSPLGFGCSRPGWEHGGRRGLGSEPPELHGAEQSIGVRMDGAKREPLPSALQEQQPW